VATDVSYLRAVIEDRVTGSVVPASDPPALAAALVHLLQDHDLRRSYAQAGPVDVGRRLGWDHMAQTTRETYAEVVAGRAGAVG
jgi:glycosyltransferase involved in cell wall biosynthesis